MKSGAQVVKEHCPTAQTVSCTFGRVHGLLQAPQFCLSVRTFVVQVPAPQVMKPVAQVAVHLPAVQEGLPFTVMQRLSQAPQLKRSAFVSMHS